MKDHEHLLFSTLLLTVGTYALRNQVVTHQREFLIFVAGYLFAVVWLSPDLDIHSKPLERKPSTAARTTAPQKEDLEHHSYTQPKRAEIAKRFMADGDKIDQAIFTEIVAYKPRGVLADVAIAMNVQPRKGVRIDVPFGAYVFHEKRVPTKETVDRWFTQHKEAENKRKDGAEYAFGLGAKPNTVTGNFRVVEHARRLHAKGLLTSEEEKILQAMEKFWNDHPELDKQKSGGVWGHNLQLTPYSSKW